ncbi:DNA-directed RNA polymerase I subunit RPA34 [Mustelus asterias]
MEAARRRWEVSSSEEEGEGEAELPDTPARGSGEAAGSGKMSKFDCPSEFIPCPRALLCDLTLEKANDPSNELWLIKTPMDFDPHGFSGRKIPLVGFQTLKSKTYRDKLYNVFGTSSGAGGVNLVFPLETAGQTESCPPFAGCITIGESWEDTGSSQEPRSIPVSPAPSIPPGLKLRFQPFGADTPWRRPRKRRGKALDPGGAGEAVAKRRKGANKVAISGQEPNHEATGDSRRKKRRHGEQEQTERSDTESQELRGRKRKKRSKEKDAEIPLTVPCEVDLGHKKKKKKDKH